MIRSSGVRVTLVVCCVVCCVAAAGAACRGARASQTDARPLATVPVVPVTRSDLDRDLVLTAEFTPYQEVDVMAKVAGYVRSIRVDIGDHVRSGELLATLEVPEMRDELAKARAAVGAADAEVDGAREGLNRASASFDIAHMSFTRLADVSKREPGLVPDQDVDVARARSLEAQAQLASARSALAAAEGRATEARAEAQRLQTMADYAEIRAPFTGVIIKRYANTGSMIQAGIVSQTQAMPVVRLAQNNLLRLTFPVPVGVVSEIHVGDPLDIDVVTLGRTIRGRVTRLAERIQTATRTMDTEVDVPNVDGQLVPGMYAEAHLHVTARADALSVPLDAIEGLGTDKPRAYVVGRDHVIRIVPVQTGTETASHVEIRAGVREGDTLVVGRHTGLVEGERVDPRVARYEATPAKG